MHKSLSEIETTVAKAARGIGLPVGLGEDLGKAARFFSPRAPGVLEAFARAMAAYDDGRSTTFDGAQAGRGILQARPGGKRLSALWAGPSAMDLLGAGASFNQDDATAIKLAQVDEPLVVMAVLVAASATGRHRYKLYQGDGPDGPALATCRAGQLNWEAALSDNSEATNHDITLVVQGDSNGPAPDEKSAREAFNGVEVEEDTWKTLAGFADRLLVESTAASHLSGAGAGLLDND